ncbi:MAG: hypothetical protein GY838_13505 [bacterium]|nr:hypothetical protein [bacterium]
MDAHLLIKRWDRATSKYHGATDPHYDAWSSATVEGYQGEALSKSLKSWLLAIIKNGYLDRGENDFTEIRVRLAHNTVSSDPDRYPLVICLTNPKTGDFSVTSDPVNRLPDAMVSVPAPVPVSGIDEPGVVKTTGFGRCYVA